MTREVMNWRLLYCYITTFGEQNQKQITRRRELSIVWRFRRKVLVEKDHELSCIISRVPNFIFLQEVHENTLHRVNMSGHTGHRNLISRFYCLNHPVEHTCIITVPHGNTACVLKVNGQSTLQNFRALKDSESLVKIFFVILRVSFSEEVFDVQLIFLPSRVLNFGLESSRYGLLNFKCLMTNHVTFETQLEQLFMSRARNSKNNDVT